jgi:hypothetical protein
LISGKYLRLFINLKMVTLTFLFEWYIKKQLF